MTTLQTTPAAATTPEPDHAAFDTLKGYIDALNSAMTANLKPSEVAIPITDNIEYWNKVGISTPAQMAEDLQRARAKRWVQNQNRNVRVKTDQ